MTITITKTRLAIAIVAVAMLIPATAVATHVFVDVADGKFYDPATKWAKDNDITTGSPAGSDTFKPDDPVTRGESVTFLKRYDDNIVQPAHTALESGIATNTADIAGVGAAMPFAATAFQTGILALTDTPTAVVTVTVTAPVAGHVTVNSTAVVLHTADGGDVWCQIVESTAIPAFGIDLNAESAQQFEAEGSANNGSLSGTRTFEIAEGATVTYVLACQEAGGNGGFIYGRNLTAIFTPAPA